MGNEVALAKRGGLSPAFNQEALLLAY